MRNILNSPVQEELLGYVLGALDATEERSIQQKIETDPVLQEEVQRIRASIAPLDFLDAPSTRRPGLARRTCEWVAGASKNPDIIDDLELNDHDHIANFTDPPPNLAVVAITAEATAEESTSEKSAEETDRADDAQDDAQADTKVTLSPRRFDLLHPQTWSIADALAGVAIVAVMGSILFPTLSYQRYQSRKLACQDNLRSVGAALLQYSDINEGRFVAIPPSGKLSASGMFAPLLKDAGLIEHDNVFACAGVADATPVHIPSLSQLNSADAQQLDYLKRNMAGHFGYSMGYNDGQHYRALTNSGLTHTVLVADRPTANQPGRRSINHGTWGQNCLFGDGRIEFIKGDSVGEDAIFVNDHGVVAPGTSERDSVIAPSHLSPTTL